MDQLAGSRGRARNAVIVALPPRLGRRTHTARPDPTPFPFSFLEAPIKTGKRSIAWPHASNAWQPRPAAARPDGPARPCRDGRTVVYTTDPPGIPSATCQN